MTDDEKEYVRYSRLTMDAVAESLQAAESKYSRLITEIIEGWGLPAPQLYELNETAYEKVYNALKYADQLVKQSKTDVSSA